MALSGGGDRSELRPLRPDGSLDHDLVGVHIVGNHKGEYGSLNISSPRPGTVHQFCTRKEVLSARQRGWWVADPQVDGRPAYELVRDHGQVAPPSGSDHSTFPDLVHIVTSEENYRRLMDEREAASRAAIAGGGSEYLENVDRAEYETGRTGRGYLATRFATREHGTSVMEGEDVLEHLTPRGIMREEDV